MYISYKQYIEYSHYQLKFYLSSIFVHLTFLHTNISRNPNRDFSFKTTRIKT